LLDSQVRKRKKPTGSSWRMDETVIGQEYWPKKIESGQLF